MRPIQSYLKDHKYPLLKKEEMFALITKAQAGDKRAMEKIIKHNYGMVHNVANRYFYAVDGVIGYEDLFQEGVIGLMRSLDTFDIARDMELTTYAYFWIDTKISRYIDNNRGAIRVPIYLQSLKRKYAKLKKEDAGSHNDDFYMRLAACENESTVSNLRYAISHVPSDVRIDEKYEDGSDVFQPADIIDEKDIDLDRIDFQELLNKLGTEKRYILERRMMGWNLRKIGGHLGLSRERIRQIEEEAILRMKAMINDVKKNDVFKMRDKLFTTFLAAKALDERKS